jgi:hypothetical protein
LQILLGSTDGTFRPSDFFNTRDWHDTTGGTFADLDGDGNLDAVYPDYGDQSQIRVVFRPGRGDGTFGEPRTFADVPGARLLTQALKVADFDGDGIPDLILMNQARTDTTADVWVSLGSRGGSYGAFMPVIRGLPKGIPLALGDLNNDGRPDVAFPDGSVYLGLNDGTSVNAEDIEAGQRATPMRADLDGDGVLDLLVVDEKGEILWRRGQADIPGAFDPPVVINPDHPVRDVTVIDAAGGPTLAAIDQHGDRILLFARPKAVVASTVEPAGPPRAPASNAGPGAGVVIRSTITSGSFFTRMVSRDIDGDGITDLVALDGARGTVTLLRGEGGGGFHPAGRLDVGIGISDIGFLGSGRPDLVLTNRKDNLVRRLANLGGFNFGRAVPYPAGDRWYSTRAGGAQPTSLTSYLGTGDVGVGHFTANGTQGVVVLNRQYYGLGMLAGLDGGGLANPRVTPLDFQPVALVVADFNHDGLDDVAAVGSGRLEVFLADGRGGLVPSWQTAVSPDSTGLAAGDFDGDGLTDLLVGTREGDVLRLLGNGNGSFKPYRLAGTTITLATADVDGDGRPDTVLADQALERVAVQRAAGARGVVRDRRDGLLAPGAVALADLNGDGIAELIVANSGGNDVLVYPGLGNGQFGPELNGGKGFFTGTDPVGVTVANLNGRPDLIVADRGSNDVTILLNQATAGGGFTFVPGPRLSLKTATQQGLGPVATALVPSPTGGPPSLAVSLSGSNQVWVIPGVGGGFFNDQNPTIFPVGLNPGPIFVGTFDGRPDLVSVNAGSNDLTLISDFASPDFTTRTIPSGGVNPVTAFAFDSGGGFGSLVVGNNEDGVLALLLGGPDGLSLASTMSEPDVPSPTALVFSALTGGQVQFFAASAGREEAIPLTFDLGVVAIPEPAPPPPPGVAQLVPLRESSLSLVGTLLVLSVQTPGGESEPAPGESVASTAVVLLTGPAPSAGQSLVAQGGSEAFQDDDLEAPVDSGDSPVEPKEKSVDPPSRAASIWQRYFLGIDDAQEPQRPNDRGAPPPATGDGPSALVVPWRAGGPVPETATHPRRSGVAGAVDQFLRALSVTDADPDGATVPVPRASAQPTPGEPGPTDAAGVVPLMPDPPRPDDGSLPTTSEPAREERVDVPLSMVVAVVAASRFFSSIRPRRRPRFGVRGVTDHEFTL